MFKKMLLKASCFAIVLGAVACGTSNEESNSSAISTKQKQLLDVDVKSTVAENDAACKAKFGAESSYLNGSEVILTKGGTGELTTINVGGKVVLIKDPKRVELKQITCVK